MQHSTSAPTQGEASRIERMMTLGCVACASLGFWHVAEECHHLLEGNVRLGHWFTIPLCRGHHRGIWNYLQREILPPEKRVAISDGRKAFCREYPSERELWERVQGRLKLALVWPLSKRVQRKTA